MHKVTEHTARTANKCGIRSCGCTIEPGERYRLSVAVQEDWTERSFEMMRICRDHFYLEGWQLTDSPDAKARRARHARERLQAMNRQRGTDFQLGERVLVAGKPGKVVNSNSSSNLDVLFDGERHPANCHPFWKVERPEKPGWSCDEAARRYDGQFSAVQEA